MERWVTDIPLALALGGCIGLVYHRAYRGFFYSKTFAHTCVVTPFVVALLVGTVVQAAGQGQALAFALVGLLGLIRFRTVMRDTREFSYILLALVTGVGVGVGGDSRWLAVAGCAVALAVLVAMEWSDFAAPRFLSMRVRVRSQASAPDAHDAAVGRLARQASLVGTRHLADGTVTRSYDLVAKAGQTLNSVGQGLRDVPGTTEVSVQLWNRGRASDDKDD